jgi:protein-S-isoprenylcysteine O-methyltransferase Ste14
MDFGSCMAFALFFLGDYNDWKLGKPVLRFCFPCGFILLAVATVFGCNSAETGNSLLVRVIFGVFAAIFLALEVYTLFFALPAKDAYAEQEKGRRACTTGVYSICRHPGVLWFIGLYFCLWGAFGLSLFSAALCSALNILLIIFEDIFVFPATLSGYAEYKKTTPFLIPTLKSIGLCHSKSEERR